MPWRKGRPDTTLPKRFAAKVKKLPNGGCWLWTGSLSPKGYGQICTAVHRAETAHRVSWKLHIGPIPGWLCVLHRCDVRACVNPDHLWLGTVADNNHDMQEKGRLRSPSLCRDDAAWRRSLARGEAHYKCKLSDRDVRDIRERHCLYDAERGGKALAVKYGVSEALISKVVHRLTRSEVPQ